MILPSKLPSIRLEARPSGLKFRAPASALARFKQIQYKAAAEGEISILTEIGPENWGGYSAPMMQKQLKALGRSAVKVALNSPGGDAFEGVAIYNLLREHPGKVTVSILGIAASAASIIAMAGDRIEMGEAAMLMIHSAWGIVQGNRQDMQEFAGLLESMDQSVAALYARRTGMPVKDVLKLMEKETWMTAQEAVATGFADVMVPEQKVAMASIQHPQLFARSGSTQPAASGNSVASIRMSLSRPGVSGNLGINSMNTPSQVLAELQEARQLKMTRQGEIFQLKKNEGRDFTDAERSEFDTLDAELVTIGDNIRTASFEMRMAGGAVPIERASPMVRGAPYLNLKIKDKDDTFKGQSFARKVMCEALAFAELQKGRFVQAADIAQHRYGQTSPTLVNVLRAGVHMAAVPGAGTGTGEWGSELVTADSKYTGDFIDYLYGLTVYDRLPLRRVPAHVTIKGTDGAASANWVGESKAIPVTSGSASTVTLTPLKVAAVAVTSNELLRYADPSAEMWIRDLLANAIAQKIDTTFLSATAASAGVSPAGILNGVSAKTTAGATADNIRTDLEVLASGFIAAKNATNLWVVTSPGLGLALRLMKNALGMPEFSTLPDGSIEGFTLLTGDNVGSGDVIMLKPDEIWRIGDMGIEIAFSRDATIEQDSAPTGATDTPVGMTTTNATNMFQSDSTAIRVIRPTNFQKRRAHAVDYVGDANYGGVAS